MTMQEASEFLRRIGMILEKARQNVKTAVNLNMVYTYYEIGRQIVEEEQNGKGRAEYGKRILAELSAYLTDRFGKGYSAENLKLMRRFYQIYSNDSIGETVFTQFKNLPKTETGRRFYLSWSHYLKLMRITNVDERHFYEIESVRNDWSLAELRRQFDSALYERMSLSRDKEKVAALSKVGHIVETPSDAVKDPYVLEFLGLPELPSYTETELENRIIDHLQSFLLELGKGLKDIPASCSTMTNLFSSGQSCWIAAPFISVTPGRGLMGRSVLLKEGHGLIGCFEVTECNRTPLLHPV